MEWRTKITDLLSCKYPILQGAMGAFGNWKLAAAVSNAGALGMLTAAVSITPEKLREDIRRCLDATDKPIGVNLSYGACAQIEEMLEVCIEEGIEIVETSGYKPDALVPRIKEVGLKWIHKSSRVKDALHAEKLGTDAIIVIGLEGAGVKHPLQLPTLTTTIWAVRELKVPFVAAGGICDARGFLGVLIMGAEGVEMATAFLATEESPMSKSAKGAIVRATLDDWQLVRRVLTPPDPQAYEEALKMRDKMPLNEWLHKLEGVVLREPDWASDFENSAKLEAKLSKMVSLSAGMIDRVVTVKELIDSIIHEAEELLKSHQFLRAQPY